MRDDRWSVHIKVTDEQYRETAQVFDLEADPEEERDVAAQNSGAIDAAVARLREIGGALPFKYTEYRQRAKVRNMRTFASKIFR